MTLTWEEYIALLTVLGVMGVVVGIPIWLFLCHTRLGRTLCEILHIVEDDEEEGEA